MPLTVETPKRVVTLAWCLVIAFGLGSQTAFARQRPQLPLLWRQAGIQSVGRSVNRSRLWRRSYRNILYHFDDMYNFRVLYVPGAAYPYKAWFFGWAVEDCNRNIPANHGCDAILSARAKLVKGPWEVYAGGGKWDATMSPSRWVPVLTADHTYYDQWHNGDPSVVKVGNRYYMAYSSTGFNQDGVPSGQPGDTDNDFGCVMGAVSIDGIHWRISKAPIAAHRSDFGKPFASGSYVQPNGFYQRPSLLYDGRVVASRRANHKFQLWFDYGTHAKVGYAENKGDFLNPKDWKIVRSGSDPCLVNFPNPNVVKVKGIYFGYGDPGGYKPPGWSSRKITEAISLDGVDWLVLGHLDSDPDAPATQVPEAFVQRIGNTNWLYLFYACQIGGKPYNWRYNRIRYMRRPITGEEIRFLRRLWKRRFGKTKAAYR